MSSFGKEYLDTVIRRFRQYKELGDKTFAQLNDADFHYHTGNESNSIAVIIQHLSGNMLSRWTNFLTEDGEKAWRQRDEEFNTHTSYTKQQLIDIWEKGWGCLLSTLGSLKEDDLLKTIYIRKEALSVIDAINRQLAHYPYHVGQIVFIGKMLQGENWQSLSIPRGQSKQFNAEKFAKEKHREHFTSEFLNEKKKDQQ